MRLLIVAEHDHQHLHSATRRVVSAAVQIGGDVEVLVAGSNCQSVALEAASLAGVTRVRVCDAGHHEAQTAENLAALVLANAQPYTHILVSDSPFGKNVLPRIAALLDVEQISGVCRVISPDTFVRPIYAGSALETVRSCDAQKVLSIRAAAFESVGDQTPVSVERVAAVPDTGLCALLRRDVVMGRRELGSARVVVAGGRGLGSAAQFVSVLTPLADTLGAAVGASYGAVSAGYAANDLQIGQTGKIIAPDLYIAVGISGAIQHVAGMKDAKVIVAINKDPEAPIFKLADYGLVGDLFELVPALVRALA